MGVTRRAEIGLGNNVHRELLKGGSKGGALIGGKSLTPGNGGKRTPGGGEGLPGLGGVIGSGRGIRRFTELVTGIVGGCILSGHFFSFEAGGSLRVV